MDARPDQKEMKQAINKFLQLLEKQEKKGFKQVQGSSTGICLGILCCSLLQVIAVMYQTCWFTIYKWLWCRIWEFMTREVESDKRNKSHFLDIKAIQSDACHLLWSKWHQRTRRAKYFYHRDLIKHFSQKKADVRAVVVDQCRYSK